MKAYSTTSAESELLSEIKKALESIKWGSIEIFVQDSMVVQITQRSIKKMTEQKDKLI